MNLLCCLFQRGIDWAICNIVGLLCSELSGFHVSFGLQLKLYIYINIHAEADVCFGTQYFGLQP